MQSNKWAVLINPPVYDTQYWARWAMPHGLLKIATWLKQNGYATVLYDCLNPYGVKSGTGLSAPEEGYDTVRKTKKWVIKCACGESDPEWLRELGKDIPQDYRLKPTEKFRFVFGMPVQELEAELQTFYRLRKADGDNRPVEVWITSVMTYWWESTGHVIEVVRRVFGDVRIRVGGIYPTLASEHAEAKLGLIRPRVIEGSMLDLRDDDVLSDDLIVKREVPDASWLPLDLTLYSDEERPPYTILTTSRGCSHTCSYCAASVLNNSRRKVVSMEQERVVQEIRDKFAMGIRHFCFYEDNLLMNLANFKGLLKRILDDNLLRGIKLYAPEGIEIAIALNDTKVWLLKSGDRNLGTFWVQPAKYPVWGPSGQSSSTDKLVQNTPTIGYEGLSPGVKVRPDTYDGGQITVQVGTDIIRLRAVGRDILWTNQGESKRPYKWADVPEVLYLMHKAGFEKIYLPLETVKASTNQRWNRAWNKLPNFERLMNKLTEVGYSTRKQDINAFVMFGLPGEDIEEIMDTALFASAVVGSVIPMLFTPVPSTPAFEDLKAYIQENNYDLQHLNGKLFPFFGRLKQISDERHSRPLTLEDYIRLEAFMQRLNAKVMGMSFDILDEQSRVAGIFRDTYVKWKPRVPPVFGHSLVSSTAVPSITDTDD